MNVLIVYAHPDPHSFNAAMRDVAVDALTEAGNSVQVSDLYALHFKAVLDEHDFKERQNPDFFNPIVEQHHAATTNTFAEDIKLEIEKVQWADLILFQFPLWWLSFPAILKGWFDRVFVNGVAANFATYEPLLTGKRAMLAFTTGGSAAAYSAHGPIGDINELLAYVTRGIFRTAGLNVIPPFIAFGASSISSEQRHELLHRYRRQLLAL
ncbi:MAG: NAD(P)H-dependent oxidoreductase [Halobacteriota archaeon]